MLPKAISVTVVLLAVATAMIATPTLGAQEHGTTGEQAAHEGHNNQVALFVGAATHLHNEETGFAIGLEFERRLSNRLFLAVFGEYASSKLERDFLFGV